MELPDPETPRLEFVRELCPDLSEKEVRMAEWRMWRVIKITRAIYLEDQQKSEAAQSDSTQSDSDSIM